MATLASLRTRIDNSLKLLGTKSDTVKDDNISDALGQFISMMDWPRITASVVIVDGTKTYSIPSTIEKIIDIRDEDGDSVVYSTDTTVDEFTLQDAANTGATYTVYGTPKDTRTNLDTIIAAVPGSMERVLWAYIVAFSYSEANEESYINRMNMADKMAIDERKNLNRDLDFNLVTEQFIDNTGQKIGDVDNAEGINVQINDYLESDI
jgi:hypothetical protein